MGASASTISVTDFSEAKAIYDAKIAEGGLSDEELFAQIKAAIDAKHHTPEHAHTAVVDAHDEHHVAIIDAPVEDHTVHPTEIAVA
jgi:hypothetical protein